MHSCSLFFFNAPATTEIYTLSLHDALPISRRAESADWSVLGRPPARRRPRTRPGPAPCSTPARSPGSARRDRKSTRLNSSHVEISYAVFCLKKKKKKLTKIQAQHIKQH